MDQPVESDKVIDPKERYEKRNNAELKSVEWFKEKYSKIYKLLQRGKFFRDSNLLIKKRNETTATVLLYTNDYSYAISMRKPDQDDHELSDDGYLGCICSLRKPYAGEDWTRGNDLSDGSYSEETWNNILSDILNNELKEIKLGK